MKPTHLKPATLVVLTCTAALVTSLTGCGGDNSSALPTYTGGSNPSTTATTRAAATTPTAASTEPASLVAHSTYTYGGLTVVVNLPADIPAASRPTMRWFTEFIQADGRTTAASKLDPAMPALASANVVKDTRGFLEAASVQGVGSEVYTMSTMHTSTAGYTRITGCLDQSKLVQVRKDGSRYVDKNVKKNPTLKMTAEINTSGMGRKVTSYTFAGAQC